MTNTNKTYNYVVELKHKSTKHITTIGLLLLFFVFMLFVSFVYQKLSLGAFENMIVYPKILLAVIAGSLSIITFIYKYLKYKNGDKLFLFWPIALASFMWLSIPKMEWLIVLYIIIAYLDKPLKVSPEYGFDEIGITFNSFPEKKYSWYEIANVVVKFGMLSIDFHNNKIIQSEISEDISLPLEKEFNEFCKYQINKRANPNL